MYLAIATLYLLALAVSSFITRERKPGNDQPVNRFAVLVPAHDEELLIGALCRSLLDVDYPKDCYTIHIIADNCNDNTVSVASEYDVNILQRNNYVDPGKGQALAWSLAHIDLNQFDVVFIVDADNYVDGSVLFELNRQINAGEQAIQFYNAVGNRKDSWFTNCYMCRAQLAISCITKPSIGLVYHLI